MLSPWELVPLPAFGKAALTPWELVLTAGEEVLAAWVSVHSAWELGEVLAAWVSVHSAWGGTVLSPWGDCLTGDYPLVWGNNAKPSYISLLFK